MGWRTTTRRATSCGTLGIATLGGATLYNEENYFIKKLMNERWGSSRWRTRRESDTRLRCPVWAPRSGAAVPATFQQDLANADCIRITGSNMAESHPVGFQWVVEAGRAARR